VVFVIAHISDRLTSYFQKIAFTYGRKNPKDRRILVHFELTLNG